MSIVKKEETIAIRVDERVKERLKEGAIMNEMSLSEYLIQKALQSQRPTKRRRRAG